jgi:aminopeptidase N
MSQQFLARTCALALAGSLLAAPVAGSAQIPLDRATGWSSGGDPYFPLDGNRGYDVDQYRVTNTYRPDTDRLRGTTLLRARAREPLSQLSLDLVLTVDRVLVDGLPAEFSRPHRHELLVEPQRPLRTGHSFTVVVDYHGRPASIETVGVSPGRDLYFHRPGDTVAMGEPQNGAWWFAANETPRDKASFDVILKVPRGTEALSGGGLVSRETARGWTEWHWRLGTEIPTYAAFFAVGQYRIDRSTTAGRSYIHAVSTRLDEDDEQSAMQRLQMTDDVVSWFEEVLAPYPFEQGGGVVTGLRAGYALETATRPVYPWASASDPDWVSLLVHETAHQWFGNDVTLQQWRDLWLNEGFATYAEWWYAEEHRGPTVARMLEDTWRSFPADDRFWQLQVSDPGPARMWDEAIYVRGAMTLAALRGRIGDSAFSTLLTEWVTRYGGGNVTGGDLRSLAEEVSGEELDAFFRHWLDDLGRPDHTVENGFG